MICVTISQKALRWAGVLAAVGLWIAAVGLWHGSFPAAQRADQPQGQGRYTIVIFADENRLYLLEQDVCIKEFPVASGKPDSPSPIGQWKIVEKQCWGEGFGGYWLGLDVFWGTYGIHGTIREDSIGRSVSHGCIRMHNQDVRELFDLVPVGTPVHIYSGPFGPFGTGFRKLQPGDRGADVLAVQQRLKALGYFQGAATGIYGDDLKQAIYRFQKDKGLRVKFTLTKPDYLAMGFADQE